MKLLTVSKETETKLANIEDYLLKVQTLYASSKEPTLTEYQLALVEVEYDKVRELRTKAGYKHVDGFTLARIEHTLDKYAAILATPESQRVYRFF